MKRIQLFLLSIIFATTTLFVFYAEAQTVNVGSGSYTKTFPGTDVAGRNGVPNGTPQVSGNALGKPIPTNDWWSYLLTSDHVSNLFNYPYTMRTVEEGLVVSYIPWGVISDLKPITVGVAGLSAPRATVSDHSDWTVSINWENGAHQFNATSGIGMPFLYFTKNSADVAQVQITSGTVTNSNEMLVVENAINGASFAIYAPAGSSWTQNGNIYTSTLNGKNYWSMAMLPFNLPNTISVANEYKKYAYVFPANTTATWNYNESTSVLKTDFTVTTDVKEGAYNKMLIGLLPHQWSNLGAGSPAPDKYTYPSVRGELKTMAANAFSVENTFYGILPTLPYVSNNSEGFSPTLLTEKIQAIENDGLNPWTDSYNEGQMMNRLIQTARIANEMGNNEAVDKIVATIKSRLEDWLSYTSGETSFLFHYDETWTALFGYPAGHGQDININDHHFHWGYFIHAAAFMEQFEPGWANNWGEMVNVLIRDAAAMNRNDALFPYLRNFSPYAGHCWANGFASFPQGNDQESTSESMQFNSALIHWGSITGNTAIRDLGIYLYTTEQTAIEEYWLDMYDRNFHSTQQYSLVSRVWGNSYDNGTFWTDDIAASYGIELYPIHGGSLYLGHNHAYATKLWNEIKANTGITANEENSNLWHDVFYKFAAFVDPELAIQLYDSYPDRGLKFGTSDAQTYYWLHSMNALGKVDATITANYPIAAAFTSDSKTTYVAHNYTNSPITVVFSTGYELDVPANGMKTSEDIEASGVLKSSFNKAFTNGSVELSLNITNGNPTKVEFVNGSTVIGTATTTPYKHNVTNLAPGKHSYYARIYEGEKFNTSNSVQIVVGSQVPYNGTAWAIPGTIEAGKYDVFEGGNGQNVTYLDVTTHNEGGFRPSEYVDVSEVAGEGATVGWIEAGEWLEYTVNVAQTGLYKMDFRFASGIATGGGPFNLEVNGENISGNITTPTTSDWNGWATNSVNDIPLTKGEQVLRVKITNGGFNLGKMTFTRTGDIPFSVPTADAGGTKKVLLPATSTTLDGSASTESTNQPLSYEWIQLYGPSVIEFASANSATTVVNGLVEGVYRIQLKVTNSDARSDLDEMTLIVTSGDNSAPTISITSPLANSSFGVGELITISANAGDIDGTVQTVDFYQNGKLIGSVTTAPFTIQWSGVAGSYDLTAKATDNNGATTTSQAVSITIAAVETCSGTSNEAIINSFDIGYIYSFETVGSNVVVTFDLLDAKLGVVGILWNRDPFYEIEMTHVEGNKYTATLTGKPVGSTVEVACKFAYAGGMSVTEYFTYQVGENCEDEVATDTEAPTVFTATAGDIAANRVELVLSATDNSGIVTYEISYDGTIVSTTAASGVETRYTVSGLTSSTNYSFSIVAKDASGNVADNSPLIIQVTTDESATSTLNTIDYETVGHDWVWVLFENGSNAAELYEVVPNPNPSGINQSATVAKYIVNADGQPWAGLWSANIGEFTFTAENSIVKTMVYKDVVSDFTLKFENEDASIQFEIKVANTVTNQWEELTFDFSEHIGKAVSKLVIIPDFPDVRTSGSVNYWDNISFNSNIFSAISNMEKVENATLYPNPVRNQLTIESSEDIGEIIIRDLTGLRMIYNQVNEKNRTLNLDELSTGVFFVTIIFHDGSVETHKIMKF